MRAKIHAAVSFKCKCYWLCFSMLFCFGQAKKKNITQAQRVWPKGTFIYLTFVTSLINLQHFEELVEEHFTHRSHHILRACQVYMDGAPVGCPLESVKATGGVGHDSCSTGFKIMLGKLFPKLVSGFTERGIDCSQFAK